MTGAGETNPGPIWYLGLALLCSDSGGLADRMPIAIASPTPTTPHFPLLLYQPYLFSLIANWMWNKFYRSPSIFRCVECVEYSKLCEVITFHTLLNLRQTGVSLVCLKSGLGLKFGGSSGRKRSIPVIHPALPAPDSSDPSHPAQLSNTTHRLTANNQSAGDSSSSNNVDLRLS